MVIIIALVVFIIIVVVAIIIIVIVVIVFVIIIGVVAITPSIQQSTAGGLSRRIDRHFEEAHKGECSNRGT